MRVGLLRIVATAVSIAFLGQCWGQDMKTEFELGFSSEDGETVEGVSGLNFNQTIDCTLMTSESQEGIGVQGWSIGLAGDPGLDIVGITVDGTAAATEDEGGLRRGGFEKSELTEGEGNTGAVSAVILSFNDFVTLSVSGTETIARVHIRCPFPDVGVTANKAVRYVDGLRGAGQPVDNVITHGNTGVLPRKTPYEVTLRGVLAEFELAFDGENSETIEGVYGQFFTQAIDCTLTTSDNQAVFGAQGWSIGLAGDPGLDIVGITVDGTAAADEAEGGRRRGGFEKSELTEGEGNQGAVSAVILSFTEFVTLPASGTEPIATIEIRSPFPEVDVTETRAVRYVDGLQGAGQPVENIITHVNIGVLPRKRAYEVALLGIDENAVTYDCNVDGRVNIADVQCLLNWLFLGGGAPGCQDAMNFNGDARLNIADGIAGLNYLFLGGMPPAAGVGCQPYPNCDLQDTCGL